MSRACASNYLSNNSRWQHPLGQELGRPLNIVIDERYEEQEINVSQVGWIVATNYPTRRSLNAIKLPHNPTIN